MTQYSGKIIRKNPVTPTQQSASGVWTTADAAAAVKNNNWPVAGVPNPISRSVRTRSSASAYFNRTFSTPTLSTKWTWSGWVKRGTLGAAQTLFSGQVDVNNWGIIAFLAGDTLSFQQADAGSVTSTVTTTQVFRDPSAWYHIVVVFDSTQATAANRLKMYVNGVQVTAFGTATYLAQNTASRINAAVAHQISRYISAAQYFDGYMTEVNFVDGQALTPSSFGTTDSTTGAWVPMPYTGTYGTNGFYLNFKDNTSTTTIGYDYSGNSNNWTANNISLTAGVTYDSMVDVPTLWMAYNTAGDTGALVRGNYATLNPLQSAVAPSDGNLKITGATAHRNSLGTINLPSTSKFYFEGFAPAIQRFAFGLAQRTMDLTVDAGSSSVFSGIYGDSSLTRCWNNGTSLFTLSAIAANDVFQIAVDCATGKVWLGRNNTFYSSAGATTGDPVAGTNATFTLANITDYTSVLGVYDNASNSYINFGQRPFTYTPPTGFKTLNTFNLPAPTINNGASYMAATLWTGNGTTQSITNTVNGVSFQPDFVWIKDRSAARSHILTDAVRGTTQQLYSNETTAEATNSDRLTAFNSNGFNVGTGLGVNASTETFVGWQWNAGGSTVTNTSGTISAQVRANPTAGFSVVTYTGTAANATVGHGLGVAPSMIITKNRDSATAWWVYHTSLGNTQYLVLNTTAVAVTSSSAWNNTSPTSTVFSLGAANPSNANQDVAYCFAAVAGYSAFGSYTGNGSADGSFVFLGFRPRFVMIKNITNAQPWIIIDTARNTFNVAGDYLSPDSSGAENYASSRTTATNDDILSNGFKLRNDASSSGYTNASANTYIYAAFAENPFKYSNAR